MLEVPPSTVVLFGLTLPVAGGGYLRLLPYAVTRWALKRLNVEENKPAIVYLHPWELDPDQPRIRTGLVTRWRHYTGVRTVENKLRSLMRDHRFGALREIIGAEAYGRPVQMGGAG